MTKAFCLLNFIFQEPYIIWSWLMLQICNRIISPGVFLHFFQILIFGVRCGENGLKWEKIVCASTPYLSKNTSYDCVFCYTSLKCYLQMIFSFLNVLVFWFVTDGDGGEGKKWPEIIKKIKLHISGTVPRMIVVCCTHMQIDISSKFFDYFKSDFFGFSKYINKCQKEILTCAPPSSHMCVCFSSTMTPFVLKYHLYSSKAGNISLRQMVVLSAKFIV